MNCTELHTRLQTYVDGELPVGDTVAADAHTRECPACAALVNAERAFRQLLRRQPREPVPPEFRRRLVARLQSQTRRRLLQRWLVGPALAAAAAAIIVFLVMSTVRPVPPLISELVDKHIAYAQVDRPAELPSEDRAAVTAWFRERAGLHVTVPDYSPSGIRLIGARLAEAREHRAAYLLYEKGHTLLSVFMLPVDSRDVMAPGKPLSFRGHEYVGYERKGYRTVSWTDGRTMFGLVSMLDYGALLECADRLRMERQNLTRL
jgi:anti-sigma factor (TIGR02949 family)